MHVIKTIPVFKQTCLRIKKKHVYVYRDVIKQHVISSVPACEFILAFKTVLCVDQTYMLTINTNNNMNNTAVGQAGKYGRNQ